MDKTNRYQQLLKAGRNELWRSKRFVDQYWYELCNDEGAFTWKPKSECVWCGEKRKRDNFSEDEKLCSAWCKFCVTHRMDDKHDYETGVEPHLNGIWFELILKINHYIYTTASTNHPQILNLHPDNIMFVDALFPKEMLPIIQEFVASDPEYKMWDFKPWSSGERYLPIPNGIKKDFSDLLEDLVFFEINDQNNNRSDFYQKLYDWLKTHIEK